MDQRNAGTSQENMRTINCETQKLGDRQYLVVENDRWNDLKQSFNTDQPIRFAGGKDEVVITDRGHFDQLRENYRS